MARVRLCFHAELNDFLPAAERGRGRAVQADDGAPLRHLIEACGVPHTEVAMARREGEQVGLQTPVSDDDRIDVWPFFAALAQCPELRERDPLAGARRFLADAHLGRLARHLRMLGFDTRWDHDDVGDARLAELAATDGRILLSSDRRLLMRRQVGRGCFVRGGSTWEQLEALTRRLDLCAELQPFTRCTLCNARLAAVALDQVRAQIPPRVRELTEHYWRCDACGRIYWRGTHWRDMRTRIRRLCPGTSIEGDAKA